MSIRYGAIRLVYNGLPGTPVLDPTKFTVFDLETGAKLLNVYRIELDVSRDQPVRVRLTLGTQVEYEGLAEIVTEGEDA